LEIEALCICAGLTDTDAYKEAVKQLDVINYRSDGKNYEPTDGNHLMNGTVHTKYPPTEELFTTRMIKVDAMYTPLYGMFNGLERYMSMDTSSPDFKGASTPEPDVCVPLSKTDDIFDIM
jgi:hypothetical protein